MTIAQGGSILTAAECKEVDDLFSLPPQSISMDLLHEFSSRVFSENMTALNMLRSKKNDAPYVKTQIKYIKNRYNQYFNIIHDHIYQSCTDQKSVEAWLRIANDCQEKYNDMLGHIIRNALAKVMAENKIEIPSIKDSFLYKKLYGSYFPSFSITDNYKEHLLSAMKTAIAPALPFYIADTEESIKREEDIKRIREMKQLLTDDEWKLITNNIVNTSGEIYDQIDNVLLNLGKSQHINIICDTFKEFNIDDHESLWRKFNKAESHPNEKRSTETDPFIAKYTTAINQKLVRKIPIAPTTEKTTQEQEEANTAVTEQAEPSRPVRATRAPAAINFEEELRLAKSKKNTFNESNKNSSMADGEIKEVLFINNEIIGILIRQRNACEERCINGDIPPNEYKLQESINAEIDALKIDNAVLRKKLFKPDEDKKDRNPVVAPVIAPVIERQNVAKTSTQPPPEQARESANTKDKTIDTSNSGKFVYKRPMPIANADVKSQDENVKKS